MSSNIDDLLDMVDQWKFKLHDKLKKMTPEEETVFWNQAAQRARKMGLNVIESPRGGSKRPAKGRRRTA